MSTKTETKKVPYNSEKLEIYVKKNYKVSNDQWRAIHSITHDIHDETILSDYTEPYKLSEQEYNDVIKIASDLRKIVHSDCNEKIIDFNKYLIKQIKKPFKFYVDNEGICIYFKDSNNQIYESDSNLEYFSVHKFLDYSSDWELELPKLNPFNYSTYLDYSVLNILIPNIDFEFEKLPDQNGYWIALYREINKNKFVYKFDFIKFDGINEIYKKNKKENFTIKISVNDIICWIGSSN